MKTVEEIVNLLCDDVSYELIGAKTGRKLASSFNNKKETIKRLYFDKPVPDHPIRVDFRSVSLSNFIEPIIKIWVSGE